MATVEKTLEASGIIQVSDGAKLASEETDKTSGEKTVISQVAARTSGDVTAIFKENTLQNGDLLPILGGVTIISKLGGGNMGIVYLAERNNVSEYEDKRVVIKVLKADDDPKVNGDLLPRFKQEAKIAETIGNINNDGERRFPECFGYFEHQKNEDRIHCIAMEFVPGVDLDTLITSKKMSLEAKAYIALQLIDKLARYHDHGIVHRDVKPANIKIGNGVTIMDQGLARGQENQDELTQAGMALGSPVYMSPEAWHDQVGSRDPKRDAFSLAITLHQLITGRRPAEIETMEKYLDHYRLRQHIDIVDHRAFPESQDPDEAAFISSIEELIRLLLHPDAAIRISVIDAKNIIQKMIILPENNAENISINSSKNTFAPDEVIEVFNAAASEIQLCGYGEKICDFDAKTFVCRAFIAADKTRAMQLSGRSKLQSVFRWGAGSTIAAGLLSTLGYINYLNRQDNFVDSPIRVITTPDLVEVPKPTNVAFTYDEQENLQSIGIHIHLPSSETNAEYRETIELEASEALIIGYSNPEAKTEDQKDQYCYTFLCGPNQMRGIKKMFSKGLNDESDDEAKIDAKAGGMGFIFPPKNERSILYFPTFGVAISNNETVQIYTNEEIEEGSLKEEDVTDILSNINDTHMIQDFATEALKRSVLKPNYGEVLTKRGMPAQIAFLMEKLRKQTITHASATSNQ